MGENLAITNISLFISGVTTTFFIFQSMIMMYFANTKSTQRGRNIMKTVALMYAIIAMQVVTDAVVFGIMGLKSQYYGYLLSLVDLAILPVILSLIYSSTRNHIVKWKLLGIMELLMVIPIAAYAITASDNLFYTIIGIILIIILVSLILSLRSIRTYNKRLKDTYSDTDSRELKWMAQVIYVIGSIGTLWFIFGISTAIASLSFIYYLILMTLTSFMTKNMVRQNYDISVMQDVSMFDNILKNEEKVIEEVTDELLEKEKEEEEDLLGKRIRKYLIEEKHFMDPGINVATLAAEVGSNRTYLAAWFKKTGEQRGITDKANFNGFINLYRMVAAGELLRTTQKSIVEIYTKVGYESQQTFYRVFKETYGVSPAEYRQGASTSSAFFSPTLPL